MTASEELSKVISEITVEMPLWEDWLLRGSSQKWTIRWTGRASWRRGIRGLPGWSGFARCGIGCVLIRIAQIAWSEVRGQAYVKREEQGMGKKNVMKH